jgi:hypothetical protein
MTVSRDNSLAIYQGIKDAGIKFLTALPETWLVYLLQMADDDPHMNLIEVAKEEEAVGIAAGAYFAGEPNILLMQNHGFFGSDQWHCLPGPTLQRAALYAHCPSRPHGGAVPVAHQGRHRHRACFARLKHTF